MTWYEAAQIFVTGIISIGGAGAIIVAFSSYIGKMWANQYLESIKKENQKEIEGYKSELDTQAKNNLESIKKEHQKEIEGYRSQLEMFKEISLRYSSQQFELYNKLWHSLYELKLAAHSVWEEASPSNLEKFSKQLNITNSEVEKSYLFIESGHYGDLIDLLDRFNNYQFGKKRLVEIYNIGNVSAINPNEIEFWINKNRNLKLDYEQLILNIRKDLKKQIRGVNGQYDKSEV